MIDTMKMFSRYLASLLIVLHVSVAGYGQNNIKEQVDKLAARYMSEKGTRSLVIGVISGGRQEIFTYGETEKGSGARPDSLSMFRIGDVTKLFTATILSDMVVKGELKMDDPVQKYMPGTVWLKNYQDIICLPEDKNVEIKDRREVSPTLYVCFPDPGSRPVNILLCDLATHTSSFPREASNLGKWKQCNDPYKEYTQEKLYGFLNNFNPGKPGYYYHYSNVGFAVLGLALGQRAQLTYDSLLQQRVGNSTGMKYTASSLLPQASSHKLDGHSRHGKRKGINDFGVMAPSLGLWSNASDMMKFLAANMGVSKTSLKDAMDQAHNSRYKITKGKEKGAEIGLAWMTAPLGMNDLYYTYHAGDVPGYSSYIGFTDSTRTGVVVLSNCDRSVEKLAVDILKVLNSQTPIVPSPLN